VVVSIKEPNERKCGMKNSVVLGCGIMLAAVVIGCGSSSPDATVKDMISLMNEEAGLMESKADKAKLDAVKARGESLKKKWDSFSKEQQEAAMAKHKEEFAKAFARALAAQGGFKMPDFKDFKMPKLP
jgi:hypothetical protein